MNYTAALEDGSSLPSWLKFDKTTDELSGTPSSENIGELNILLKADDGELSISQTFNLKITEKIVEGTYTEVRNHPKVIEAYLGRD